MESMSTLGRTMCPIPWIPFDITMGTPFKPHVYDIVYETTPTNVHKHLLEMQHNIPMTILKYKR